MNSLAAMSLAAPESEAGGLPLRKRLATARERKSRGGRGRGHRVLEPVFTNIYRMMGAQPSPRALLMEAANGRFLRRDVAA
jgi:hypothetical protein